MRFAYVIYGVMVFTASRSTKMSETNGADGLAENSSVQLRRQLSEIQVALIKSKTFEQINKSYLII